MIINRHLFHKEFIVVLFLIMDMFVIPLYIMGQSCNMHLYEPNQTTDLYEIESILKNEFYEPISSGISLRTDTTKNYKRNSDYVFVGYSPQSKLIFEYECEWYYNSSLKDEFNSNIRKATNKSQAYFMNIRDSLCRKYGEPTSIHYQDGSSFTIIDEKSKLDTFNYDNLFVKQCHFVLYWSDSDRTISLAYENGHILYSYLNRLNQATKNKEIASINKELASKKKREQAENYIKWGTLLFFIILAVYCTYRYITSRIKTREEEERAMQEAFSKQRQIREKEKAEKRKQTEEQMKLLEEKHNNYVSSLVEKFGSCDKIIKINQRRPFGFNEILVFSQTKHVVIVQKEYSFSDILDCEVNDDIKERETVQTFRGNSTATSKTNTGNMIGRTIAGGVLLGGAGAIIGGSTAKRNTIIEHGTDTSIHNKEIEHNYTVAITVKDISNPVLYLKLENNTALKDEIVSLMKVIMSMK